MGLATFVWGDSGWIVPTIVIAAIGLLVPLWIRRGQASPPVPATVCRAVGWLLICACLANPLWSSARPRRGANVLAVVTDISRSHLVSAPGDRTRAELLRDLLNQGEVRSQSGWISRIDEEFDLQRYVVDDRMVRVDSFEEQAFNGAASNLCLSLEQLQQRFADLPLAGVILLSDGNATDNFRSLDCLRDLAPVYPVIVGDGPAPRDVAVGNVVVRQTAFDDAPVTIRVQAEHTAIGENRVRMTLLNSDGVPLETRVQAATDTSPVRFDARPDAAGTVFYRVRAELLDDAGEVVTTEATNVNNERLIAVDRGSAKRRVLYVSGRPNWEFKFLRRAVETDPQTELVGLIRIARREARFDFRGHAGESSNSLFRGFDETEQELAEEFDEPVMVRLGTQDETELASGFPEDPEELFAYDAVIIDDLESEFFTADQLQLIYEFVSKRGGGLLMMGGQESFRQGEYDRTPVGELLPIDLHQKVPQPGGPVRLSLTPEGWLQPWVRLRSDETAEQLRLQQMPEFISVNPAEFIRPGAIQMAGLTDSSGRQFPALVTQRFGRGRSAALCIGDFWRWRMNEGRRRLDEFSVENAVGGVVAPGEDPEEDLNDHARACRQMVRWLVGDVPQRLDFSIEPDPSLGLGIVRLVADLRGKDFEVRDDAVVRFEVVRPNGETIQISGEPSDAMIGRFEAVVSALAPGPYQASARATLNNTGEEPEELTATAGWASQPDQVEMAEVTINHDLLNTIAETTGGRVIDADGIDSFVDGLARSDAPLVEVWSWQLWHQWWVFAAAVGCFVTEWTLRRRHGLP